MSGKLLYFDKGIYSIPDAARLIGINTRSISDGEEDTTIREVELFEIVLPFSGRTSSLMKVDMHLAF